MYAIIEDGGRQYRVEEGQQLEVDYRDVPKGEKIEFGKVLESMFGIAIDVGALQRTHELRQPHSVRATSACCARAGFLTPPPRRCTAVQGVWCSTASSRASARTTGSREISHYSSLPPSSLPPASSHARSALVTWACPRRGAPEWPPRARPRVCCSSFRRRRHRSSPSGARRRSRRTRSSGRGWCGEESCRT